MKEKLNPYAELILYCVDIAAAEYSSGKITYDEAIDYGLGLIDACLGLKELNFNEIVNEFYNDFVSVKDIEREE